MENHPLLEELLQSCKTYNVEPHNAYTVFEVYQELSEVRKFSNLNYHFSEKLNLFYITGKKESTDEHPSVFIPVIYNYEITPQQMALIQDELSPNFKQCYLFIRDRDSSSTCYCITRGLVKPDSPETCRQKKETEGKKYQFERSLQCNRKLFYSKALRNKKEEPDEPGKSTQS